MQNRRELIFLLEEKSEDFCSSFTCLVHSLWSCHGLVVWFKLYLITFPKTVLPIIAYRPTSGSHGMQSLAGTDVTFQKNRASRHHPLLSGLLCLWYSWESWSARFITTGAKFRLSPTLRWVSRWSCSLLPFHKFYTRSLWISGLPFVFPLLLQR